MICDIQRASTWRRMSALLLDVVLIAIIASGFAYLLSIITNYGHYDDVLNECYAELEEKYGVPINITRYEYEELPQEEKDKYDALAEELNSNEEALYAYNMTVNLMIVIVSIGILLSILILEFVIPLIFKNGQTIGKKCFALGVVKNNSVRITTLQLFVRSFLGKYAIEIMIPTFAIILILFGNGGLFGIITLFGITIFQLILVIFSKNHTAIHDVFAYTVVIDMNTQMIFDNEEKLLEYKKEKHMLQVSEQK